MEEFRSLHLQKHLGEVLGAAEVAPTILVNRGQPRIVLMSIGEFRRLKAAAGEAIPRAALPRRAMVIRGEVDDPLGYDTSDPMACARAMAEAALSGRNAGAVQFELAQVKQRLGIRPRVGPVRSAARRS